MLLPGRVPCAFPHDRPTRDPEAIRARRACDTVTRVVAARRSLEANWAGLLAYRSLETWNRLYVVYLLCCASRLDVAFVYLLAALVKLFASLPSPLKHFEKRKATMASWPSSPAWAADHMS